MALAIPRFAKAAFQALGTPAILQKALDKEYAGMLFKPINAVPSFDPQYGALVIQGISGPNGEPPKIEYSPMSQHLMDLAYEQITPLIEEWAGCQLERSGGHGIRSYGEGSMLHLHRDRVETHVVSCIVHVDDLSPMPWALDFVDHEGEYHQLTFKKGGMLFYESLCAHGRIQPFAGDFYRNMYFHWRPKGWDHSPYLGIRSKYSSLEEASVDSRAMATAALMDAVPETWQQWIRHNRDRGCDPAGIIQRAEAAGFQRSAIEAILNQPNVASEGGIELNSSPAVGPATPVEASQPMPVQLPSWLQWFEAPLTRPDFHPRAWRLDSPLVQLYELPQFLSRDDCEELMAAIDRGLVPSTVTRGDSSYRTSRTCHLRGVDADLVARLDQRLSDLFGVDPRLSEPLQGQRYDPGQYFKEHTDWFAPGTDEFTTHTNPGGQRTWTVMIYLNTVARGGQTCFKRLGRCYTPVQGMALAWNNLMADGTPNPFTLHEAMPLEEGSKWVVTKWFRAQPGRNG